MKWSSGESHVVNCELKMDDASILRSNSKSTYHLTILKDLMINQLKAVLNTKDISQSLVIKI